MWIAFFHLHHFIETDFIKVPQDTLNKIGTVSILKEIRCNWNTSDDKHVVVVDVVMHYLLHFI